MTSPIGAEELRNIEAFVGRVVSLSPRYVINSDMVNEFDCWKFFRLTQRELFGRDLPTIQLPDEKLSSWIKLVVEYKGKLGWQTVDKPVHGCAAEMSHRVHPYHIGTWLDIQGGGVLHCTRGAGVCFSTLHDLKMLGWNRIIYDIPPSHA